MYSHVQGSAVQLSSKSESYYWQWVGTQMAGQDWPSDDDSKWIESGKLSAT